VPDVLADTVAMVECESPSADHAAVARSAEVVARIGTARLDASPEVIERDGWTHLRWRFGPGPTRVLVLGHHDTVWPLGSLATHPCEVRDGVLRGPGCFDMKAGVAIAFAAVAGLPDRTGVTVLVTGDEELGSPSSRALIEEEARGAAAAFVLEAAADGGALKTTRSGVSLYEVAITGRAAHAGLDPQRGVNAAVEAAHQLLRVIDLAAPERGTTVTPSVVRAGHTSNTVPAAASFTVDVRARAVAEQQRVHAAITALVPVLPGAAVTVTGGPNRPPLESAASADLFDRAQRLAVELGLAPLRAAEVGGASDGNFTAGVGTPTLDGLGAVGGGAHADSEHVQVGQLAGRVALLRALIADRLAGRSGATNPAATSGSARP